MFGGMKAFCNRYQMVSVARSKEVTRLGKVKRYLRELNFQGSFSSIANRRSLIKLVFISTYFFDTPNPPADTIEHSAANPNKARTCKFKYTLIITDDPSRSLTILCFTLPWTSFWHNNWLLSVKENKKKLFLRSAWVDRWTGNDVFFLPVFGFYSQKWKKSNIPFRSIVNRLDMPWGRSCLRRTMMIL